VDRIQHLIPPAGGGDDDVRISSPDERSWVAVMLGEVAVDGRLEIHQGVEHAAFEATVGQLGEEALDRVQPRG